MRSTLLRFLLYGSAAFLLAACGGGDRGHGDGHVSQGPSLEGGEEWSAEEDYRLGSVEGEGPEVLGRVRGLELDALGRTWVFDGHAQEFRVFDAGGAFVRSFGRQGEGPGEFQEVSGMAWAPDQTLWVLDPGNVRISVFDTTGALVAAHRFDLSHRVFPWPGTIDREGFLYKLQRTVPLPGRESVLVRYGPDLAPVDTLPVPSHPEGPQEWVHAQGNAVTVLRIPFAGEARWRVAPDGGMWIAITDQYRLIRLGPAGDTLSVVTRPFQPVPVPDRVADSLLSRMERYRSSIDPSQVPSFKPPVQHLYVDDEGNLWVFVLAEGEEDGRKADVFDPDGVFLASVTLPFAPASQPRPVIRDGTFAGVTFDSLGVPYVVRANIRKAGS